MPEDVTNLNINTTTQCINHYHDSHVTTKQGTNIMNKFSNNSKPHITLKYIFIVFVCISIFSQSNVFAGSKDTNQLVGPKFKGLHLGMNINDALVLLKTRHFDSIVKAGDFKSKDKALKKIKFDEEVTHKKSSSNKASTMEIYKENLNKGMDPIKAMRQAKKYTKKEKDSRKIVKLKHPKEIDVWDRLKYIRLIYIQSDNNSIVNSIKINSKLTDLMFGLKGIDQKTFVKSFIDHYGIRQIDAFKSDNGAISYSTSNTSEGYKLTFGGIIGIHQLPKNLVIHKITSVKNMKFD